MEESLWQTYLSMDEEIEYSGNRSQIWVLGIYVLVNLSDFYDLFLFIQQLFILLENFLYH